MEELRLKLIDEINKSGLPIEAVVFVVKDVYRDVNEAFNQMKREAAEKAASVQNSQEEVNNGQ